MKPTFFAVTTAAVIALGSAGAFASESQCSAPMNEWQPVEKLQLKLESEGWQVKRIKTEDGCYEAYALDKDGRRVEAYFDPKSLEMLKKKSDD